jgi:hypothetical protein
MKRIIILLFSIVCALSLMSACYWAWEYSKLTQYTMAFIRAELEKDYPELGYPFKSTAAGIVTDHPGLHWAQGKKLAELFASEEREKIAHNLSALKDEKELWLHGIKDIHGHTVDLYVLQKADTIRGLLFFPNELRQFTAENERHVLILLSLSIAGFLCLLLLILGICLISNHRRWWIIVGVLSGVLTAGLFYLWSLRYTVGFQEEYQGVPLVDQPQLTYFVQKIAAASGKRFAVVPTGIFIERMQFSPRGSSVYPGLYVNGYIWQRYDKKAHEHLDRGFIMQNAQTLTTTQLSQHATDTEEVICWSFAAILYQRFKPTLYPFDHRHLTITLLHKNFENNVVLVPDLSSYELINPLTLPGLAIKTMAHWHIVNSFFHLRHTSFGTTMGFDQFAYAHVPSLQFIATAERKIGGDFLMYLVTLALVLIIVFILLLAFLKQEVFKELVGFSTIGVLSVCCGLLFVLVTSEIDLRHTLVTDGIVYLEYLYFVCYFTILGVIINGILFATKTGVAVIQYENNLVFKLLYWPCVLLSIVLITACAIY